MIYTDEHAERLKEDAGRKWRPSNGFEGDMFMDRQCSGCIHEDDCEIQLLTMVHKTKDEAYPKEWQIGPDGQPRCTAFRDSEPAA